MSDPHAKRFTHGDRVLLLGLACLFISPGLAGILFLLIGAIT